MTYVVVVILVVVALAFGVYMYLHGGADGGRDKGVRSDEYDQQRLQRRLDDNDTVAKAEEQFQREQREQDKPPTHE